MKPTEWVPRVSTGARGRTTAPAKYVELLLDVLEQQGFDRERLLERIGVHREVTAPDGGRIPTHRLFDIYDTLLSAHRVPGIGLKLGRAITLGFLGDLGAAMLYSARIGDALAFCEQNYFLISPTIAMRVDHGAHSVGITWAPVDAMPYELMVVGLDMALGCFDALLRWALGDACPTYDAYLTRTSCHAEELEHRKLKARCHFGAPGVPSIRVELPAALMQVPMPLSNATELVAVKRRMAQQADPNFSRENAADWVAALLQSARFEQPSLALVASIAGLSPRTLIRELSRQGTSYRTISKQVRHERACDMLRNGHLSINAISETLGYADAPSFIRAFKSQAGVSPNRFRMMQTPPPGAGD